MTTSRFSICAIFLCAVAALEARAGLTRADALALAESYRAHRWQPSAKNLLHGKDRNGVEVHTPDRAGGAGQPAAECWVPDVIHEGVAYKWGGFDSLASFDAGLRAGKAAGDIYSSEKRRLGGRAVSYYAAGVDCSGFVSRCWKLSRKYSTDSLAGICRKLGAAADLRAADIMNQPGGHVLLFARWSDAAKTRALFYEAAPFSKVRAMEYELAKLAAAGFQPLRYREMRD